MVFVYIKILEIMMRLLKLFALLVVIQLHGTEGVKVDRKSDVEDPDGSGGNGGGQFTNLQPAASIQTVIGRPTSTTTSTS